MTRRDWDQVKRHFAKAKNLTESERNRYLEQASRKKDIRLEVESLLEHYDKSENLLGVYSSKGNKVLGHYEIHERIGEGGMAQVYRARDTRLRRWVALKLLHSWARGHSRSRERLIQEARCLAGLNHPNIVTIFEIGEDKGDEFIVMELISGRTLNRLIPPRGFSLQRAFGYAFQIADALASAHKAGILHGDLKPLNVMVTTTGQVKVLDFGLARALTAERATSENPPHRDIYGTKVYMAPERLRRRRDPPSARSEVFSFGLLLHEMVSGVHAFDGDTPEEIVKAILRKCARPLPVKVPDALAKIVSRCLEKNPDRRFSSAVDLLDAMTSAVAAGRRSGVVPNRTLPAVAPHANLTPPAMEGSGRPLKLRHVRTLLDRIDCDNIPQSRQALTEVGELLAGNTSSALRETVTADLKDLILRRSSEGNVVAAAVREVRKLALDVIRAATAGDLSRCFGELDLEHLDLYDMNFTFVRLVGISFRGCFLVESDFRGSNLTDASFAGAFIRNVNFAEADLSGADLTEADWFNALALTQSQLASIRWGTVLDCPKDRAAMRRYLKTHYAVPFEAWTSRVQQQLTAAWKEYLRPNGLRDKVAEWRRRSR